MANFNLNHVILGGRLTADPELKQTSSGLAVTSFSLAVKRRGSDKDRKNSEAVLQENARVLSTTDFINIVAWRKTAEFVCKYFNKGSSICVVGAVQTRSWEDKNGQKRYATDIVANEVHFVDGKSETNRTEAPGQAAEDGFEVIGGEDDLPF